MPTFNVITKLYENDQRKFETTVNLPLMTYLEDDMNRKPRKKLERTKI